MEAEPLVVGAAGLVAIVMGWRALMAPTRAGGAGYLVVACALIVSADVCEGAGWSSPLAAALRVVGAAAATSVAVRAVRIEPIARRGELILDAIAATVATVSIIAAPLGPDLGTLSVPRLAATIAATMCLVGALLSCGTGAVRQPAGALLATAVLTIGALETLAATGHRILFIAPLGYALLIAAARTAPAQVALPAAVSRGSELSRVTLVGVALCIPVWIAAIRPDRISPVATATLMVGAMTVVLMVCVRLALTGRERAVAMHQLVHQAAHDELTGLANRPLLSDRLQHALNRARRGGGTMSVLTVDLDRFKAVNDTWGHSAGDAVLVEVAARLNALVRPGDTVARIGGDEFVVVCEELDDIEDAIAIAERIVESFQEPIAASGHVVTVSVCIGVAVHRDEASSTPESLLRDAEAAMFMAKHEGPNRWELYDAELRESVQRRRDTEAALQGALDRGELRLVYQPIVSVRTREVTGFEALVRWARPGHGIVGPDDFIGLAEESNLIVEIGDWVLEQACRQVATWNSQHPDRAPLSISVNVSARQLVAPGFTDRLQRIIFHTNVDPQSLLLEITESVLVRNAEYVLGQLEGAKRLGVRLAVDDFGTGYSALAYLRQFPMDLVKIDKVFMSELGSLSADTTVIAAVIRLAQAFGQEVIAEGAETAEQMQALGELGCDYVQGYYFAPPLALAQAELLVRGRRDLASVHDALELR